MVIADPPPFHGLAASPRRPHARRSDRHRRRPARAGADEVDALTLGRRIRDRRLAAGHDARRTGRRDRSRAEQGLGDRERQARAAAVDAAHHRLALGTTADELLRPDAPSERAALEIAVERAQRGPVFAALGLPPFRVGKGLTDQTLQTILALHNEIDRLHRERAATPEEARRANAELRAEMRARDNFYPELEAKAAELLEAVGHTGGPVSHQLVADMASHLGYSLHYVGDLPHSTRSVTDKRNGRIYLPTQQSPSRDSRSPILQALASHLLDHDEPRELRRLPAPAHRDELPHGRHPAARAGGGALPHRGEEPAPHLDGGAPRPLRRLVRDGRAPVHEPRHRPASTSPCTS